MNQDKMAMQSGMGAGMWIGIVAVIIIAGGIAYAVYANSQNKEAMMTHDTPMQQDAMSGDKMMTGTKTDTSMKAGDTMMKDSTTMQTTGTMMKDTGMMQK